MYLNVNKFKLCTLTIIKISVILLQIITVFSGCMLENTFTDILDKDIFRTILKLSTKDTSSYVRSSALKVLTKAVTTKNYTVRDAIEELCVSC